jgi:argininosuccinate synthase
MTQKGILAFSGGLDTSVVVKYLQDEHDMDVITVTVDVGQGDDAKKIASKAKKLGVKKHYNIDARKEFVTDYIFPSIKANALYQKKYCLATALARPLIAEKVLEIAKKEKVTSLAHGCSGKGNDQVRFDITLRSGSDLPIIAPIRDINLDRETELNLQINMEFKLIQLQKSLVLIKICGDEQLKAECLKIHTMNHLMMHSFGLRQKIYQTKQHTWK